MLFASSTPTARCRLLGGSRPCGGGSATGCSSLLRPRQQRCRSGARQRGGWS